MGGFGELVGGCGELVLGCWHVGVGLVVILSGQTGVECYFKSNQKMFIF